MSTVEVDPNRQPGVRAIRLAREAGRRAGFEVGEVKLRRARSSVHAELVGAGVVARVEEPGSLELAERQVRIARLAAERRAPLARLVRPELQPLLIEDGAVTLWRRLRPMGEGDLEDLGRAVRALHDATRAALPPGLPVLEPMPILHRCLDWPSPWSGSPEARELRHRADRLAPDWRAAAREDPLSSALVHGDVHQEDAIQTAGGLVLLDLEDAGVGPESWDFVPLRVAVERYGLPAVDYQAFARGYGGEPGGWQGLRVMCRLYELTVAAWAMRCSADSDRMAEDASLRVATLLDQAAGRWTLM